MEAVRRLRRSFRELARLGRHLGPQLGRERFLAGGALTALFIEVALRLLEPWPLKFVFDRVIVPAESATPLPSWARDLSPGTLVGLAALALVVVVGLRALASYGATVGFALVGNRVLARVRSELYRHVQALSLSFHHRSRIGDLVVRIVGDIGLLQEVAVTALLPLVGNTLVLIAGIGLMFWLDARLALLSVALLPLFWLRTLRLSGRIREVARRQRRREGSLAATAAESVGAILTVRALALERAFTEAFSADNRGSVREGVEGKRLSARVERSVDVFLALSTALVLWYGAILVVRHEMTAGDLLVFLAYLKATFRPVRDFAKYTGRLAKAAASAERVLDVLDLEPDVKDLPGAVAAPAFEGHVRFDRVGFEYEPGQPILCDVDLELRSGERVALVGASGAGKTTFASLLLRLYEPTQGSIRIDGRALGEFTQESLRSRVGVVLQDGLLFAATIGENIAPGRPDASAEAIVAAARQAHIHDFIASLPRGYDTVLAERGATLSAGQRQRIAIARVALRDPSILILDEPTTGLDEVNARAVIDALEELSRGRTTIVITHDSRLAARADRVLRIEDGRVIEVPTSPAEALDARTA
jgi:ATP-binding cassette subfamily B protein